MPVFNSLKRWSPFQAFQGHVDAPGTGTGTSKAFEFPIPVQELDVPGTRVDFLTRCLVSAPWPLVVPGFWDSFRKGP